MVVPRAVGPATKTLVTDEWRRAGVDGGTIMTFPKKTVLVTGAASGIGAATARALHDKGADLVLADLDADRLGAISRELGGMSRVADVRDLGAMHEVVADGVARFGRIDAVVANAGIGSHGSIEQVDAEIFRAVFDTNVLGAFHTVRAALPHLLASRGYALLVSSVAAYVPAAGLAAYCASKAGVEQLANALRLELAPRGVAVGSAHMSWIDTPLLTDSADEFRAFDRFLRSLPGPAGTITSAETCGRRLAKAIEGRKRRVNVPRWVGMARWAKPLLTLPIAEHAIGTSSRDTIRQLDEEVARTGRSATVHTASILNEA